MNVENPDTKDPILEPAQVDDGTDPFIEEEEGDAIDKMEDTLNQEVEMLTKQQRVENLRDTIKSMKSKREGNGSKENNPRLDRLEHMLESLVESQKEDVHRAQIKALNEKIDNLQKAPQSGQSENEKRLQKQLDDLQASINAGKQEDKFLEYIKSSDKKFEKIFDELRTQRDDALSAKIDALTAGKGAGTIDEQLTLLSKLKDIIGDNKSKSSQIEERLIDVAFEKVMGTDTNLESEEDVFKFAIKELTPVLKTYVEKAVQQKKEETGKPPTEDDVKQAHVDAAKKIARDMVEKYRAEGRLPAAGQQPQIPQKTQQPQPKQEPPEQQQPQPAPQPQPKPAPDQAQAESKAPPEEPQPQPEPKPSQPDAAAPPDHPPQPEQEEEEMEGPPSPHSPAYNRVDAINFVLDGIVQEINDQIPQTNPYDSYVVADCLDRLDEGILQKILTIANGTDLEEVMIAFGGSREKVEEIKKLGRADESGVVKSWLTRVVVTVQDEYRKALAQAEKMAKAKQQQG